MKKHLKKITLVIFLLIAIPICGLLFLMLVFRILPDTTIFLNNDTASSISVTLLLQNHDNNLFYLSETKKIQVDETFKDNVGFESIRCIYIEHENEIYSQLYDTNLPTEITGDVHEKVKMSASDLIKDNTCPREMSTFQQDVDNGILLDRNWNER